MEVFAAAGMLMARFLPDYLLVHPMAMDYLGERYGADSAEYRNHAIVQDQIMASFIPPCLEAGYTVLVTSSAFFVLLFMGGYQLLPFVNDPLTSPDAVGFGAVLAKFAVYFGKVITMVSFMILVRWTIPRLRYDQVMMMAWQLVIPLALVHVIVVSVMVYLGMTGLVPMLLANLAVVVGLMVVAPLIPKSTSNRRLPMYGSRFSPMPGERVASSPTDAAALEDRPVQGTAPAV